MSKINTIITTICLGLGTISCTQLTELNLMDATAKEDLNVCVGACMVSSTLRWDPTGEKMKAFQESSRILDGLINSSEDLTRESFKLQITSALGRIFSTTITDIVVADIMDVYDQNVERLNANIELLSILEATKSAIDSGIILARNDTRPVRVLPYKM